METEKPVDGWVVGGSANVVVAAKLSARQNKTKARFIESKLTVAMQRCAKVGLRFQEDPKRFWRCP
jgi:hypothetical protein